MTAVSHLAGTVVTWQGKFMRQRCEWCGISLIDYDLSRMAVAVEPGEVAGPPPTWPVDQFVRVDGQVSAAIPPGDSEDKAPDDACFYSDPRYEITYHDIKNWCTSDGDHVTVDGYVNVVKLLDFVDAFTGPAPT